MRQRLPILAVVLVLTLGSCASRRGAGNSLITRTLDHDGLTRTYHVYVPPGQRPDEAPPLVIALHGGGGQGNKFDRSTLGQMRREADARGWIVVYPEGIEKGWNDGRPLDSPRDRRRGNVDDVGFISALIDRLHRDYKIDPGRVYATGISNGGFMSMRLAADLPDKVTAVAAVAATLGKTLEGRKPTAPVGVLVMNGTQDPLVPYQGGHVTVLGKQRGEILSTDDTIAWWRDKNGCPADGKSETLPDTAPKDGTRVKRTTWGPCRGRRTVVLYRIEGGGHTWPSGMQYLPVRTVGRVSKDIDAAQIIFDFFASQTR